MWVEEQPGWNLKCIKEYADGKVIFKPGEVYAVKDKFVGDDGTVKTGNWEVRNNGWLTSISVNDRTEFFKTI